MKPKFGIKDFWDDNNSTIKTWIIIIVIVTAVYITVTFVIWGLFQPSRAVIYGIVFVLFYEVFNRLIERVSHYRKDKKNDEFLFRSKKEKEEEEKEKSEDKETEEEKEDKESEDEGDRPKKEGRNDKKRDQ